MKAGYSLAKATVINLIILVLIMLFTDMSYETNDDYAISVRTLMGDPYTFYVNYFVCRAMIWLQGMIPSLNAFVLTQVALSFVAFTCISTLFFRKERGFWASFIFVLIIAIFAFDHYSIVQFTKTSILLLTAGMLLLVDAMTQRLAPGYYIAGLILFYLGSCFRIENAYVALGFAGLFLIFWVADNRSRLLPEGYLKPKRLLLYGVLLILIAGAFGFDRISGEINTSTEQLRSYQDYNEVRSLVVDYSDFKHYDDNREAFDEIGVSRNDLYLINNWYFDYDGAASRDNLEKISKVYAEGRQASDDRLARSVKKCIRECISRMKDLTAGGMHLLILAGLALSAIALMRPRYWIYVIALGAASFAIYASLYYLDRPAYRALYGVDLSAALWLIWYFDRSKYRGEGREEGAAGRSITEVMKKLVCVAFSLMLGAGLVLCTERSQDRSESIAGSIRSQAMTERIASDRGRVYLFATRDKKNVSTYATPMKAPDPDENVFTFGGWGTMSPYLLERMDAYGLDNLFEDIIDNEDVYVIDRKNVDRMEEYFNRWYGEDAGRRAIEYEKVDEVDGTDIWRAVRK